MFYRQMGKSLDKRHTMFKKADGSLYREQVMGTRGFSGTQSILYHQYMPTEVVKTEIVGNYLPEYEAQQPLSTVIFYQVKGQIKAMP